MASFARSSLWPLLAAPHPPAARLFSSTSRSLRPRTVAVTARNTVNSPAMQTTLLLASVAVAAGAYYAVYGRRSHSAQAETAGGVPTFSRFGFHTLPLASTEDVNHNVKRLRFDLGHPQTASGLTPISSLLAITFPRGRWLPVLRPYTPVDLDVTGTVELLVKQYPNGKQSTHLHSLRPGDTVTFIRLPGYAYKPNEQSHVGLVAGGQGITPCYQLLQQILQNPTDRTRVTLVWGVNGDADVYLADELDALQRAHPDRLTTHIVASNPAAGSALAKGRVTPELLKEVGIVPAGEKVAGVNKVFLSGPPPMEKMLGGGRGAFVGMGFTKAQVHTF